MAAALAVLAAAQLAAECPDAITTTDDAAAPPAPAALPAGAGYGAALALAWLTGGQGPNPLRGTQGDVILAAGTAVSTVVVKNQSSASVRLLVDAVRGDPDPDRQCGSTSFVCDVVARGEARFTLQAATTGGTLLESQCRDLARNRVAFRTLKLPARNGILFVAEADPATGLASFGGVLSGRSDVAVNGRSFSLPAIEYAPGVGPVFADEIHLFDGREYRRTPARLQPLLPAAPAGTRGELILFTPDVTLGGVPLPRVRLGGLAEDDRRVSLDFQYLFDCFDVVAVEDLLRAFAAPAPAFSIELTARAMATANDAHDAAFGDANSVRRRPAQGWLLRRAPDGSLTGSLIPESVQELVPFANDQHPVLAADPVL
jgi:hypothetical protein